jgi:hypothetical protein
VSSAQPLYPRLLRLRHVHPNGWQRALLVEGVMSVGALAALADWAPAWTPLAMLVAAAVVVKFHDLLTGVLRSASPLPVPAGAVPSRDPASDATGQSSTVVAEVAVGPASVVEPKAVAVAPAAGSEPTAVAVGPAAVVEPPLVEVVPARPVVVEPAAPDSRTAPTLDFAARRQLVAQARAAEAAAREAERALRAAEAELDLLTAEAGELAAALLGLDGEIHPVALALDRSGGVMPVTTEAAYDRVDEETRAATLRRELDRFLAAGAVAAVVLVRPAGDAVRLELRHATGVERETRLAADADGALHRA